MTAEEYLSELDRLTAKYSKYGMSREEIRYMVERRAPELDPDNVLDLAAKLTAAKMALNEFFPQAGDEFFTIAEVSHALGMTEDELLKYMKEKGIRPIKISVGMRFEKGKREGR